VSILGFAADTALIMAPALLIGAMMGMLGGGGGFLYVLVLVVIAGVPAQAAVGTGIATAAVGAAVSLLGHHRAANVQWQRVTGFLGAGAAGAVVGSIVISLMPQRFLIVLIIIGYGVVGVLPLRVLRRRATGPARHTRVGAAVVGAVAGLTVGAFAVNGGPLISSYLTGYERVEPRHAVGTAVAVLTPLSLVGSLTHLASGTIDLGYLLALAPAAAIGGYAGAHLAKLVRARILAPVLGVLTFATMFTLLLR
jgi:uncharacterized protein